MRTIIIAKYKQQMEAIKTVTPEKFTPTNHNTPNYITQDDEANLAHLLFNDALPKLNSNLEPDPNNRELLHANLMHTKLYNEALPKTQISTTKTPLGINS